MVSLRQAAEISGLSYEALRAQCAANRLPAIKAGGQWRIDPRAIQYPQQANEIPISQAAKQLPRAALLQAIARNKIPARAVAGRGGRSWLLDRQALAHFATDYNAKQRHPKQPTPEPPASWVTLKRARLLCGISTERLRAKCAANKLPAAKWAGQWMIDPAELPRPAQPSEISLPQAAAAALVPRTALLRQVRAGRIPGRLTHAGGRRWLLDRQAVKAYAEIYNAPIEPKPKPPPDHCTVQAAAAATGLPVHRLRIWIRAGELDAVKFGGRWWIPEKIISQLDP